MSSEKKIGLYFNGIQTKILYDEIVITEDKKPELGIDFETIMFDPRVGSTYLFKDDVRRELTEDECNRIVKYIHDFCETVDYEVYAYESETKVFEGFMLKSEAKSKNLEYVEVISPDHPVSKWMGDKWERVVAVILSDGQFRLMPDTICDLCTLFFTEEEWVNHSKPEKENSFYKWDFVKHIWYDGRDIEETRRFNISDMAIWVDNSGRAFFNELLNISSTWLPDFVHDGSIDIPKESDLYDGLDINFDKMQEYFTQHLDNYIKLKKELDIVKIHWYIKYKKASTLEEIDQLKKDFVEYMESKKKKS